MTPEAAAWVAEHVLTKWALSGWTVEQRRVCPCQYGPTGHCQDGDHTKCAHHGRREGYPKPSPDTHVISRRGSSYGSAPVWRAGQPCVWRCPCTVCADAPALPGLAAAGAGAPRRLMASNQPPGRAEPMEQLDLFDLAGAS